MLLDLDAHTAVLVQGITGRMGRNHAALMQRYGTRIVGGTGRADPLRPSAFPVFDDCATAVRATGATTSIALVPPEATLSAVREAVHAGIRHIVTVAEGIPVHDALRIRALAREAGVDWLGPSTPGLCIPGQIKVGFLPDISIAPGDVAVMSKSGTLSYEVCRRLVERGLGQSAWLGVGGDPVKGLRFADLAGPFVQHAATRSLLLVGEIGGDEEEEFAGVWSALGCSKPVYALIAGAQARQGVPMGHAGALVMGNRGSLASKQARLRAAGVAVFDTIDTLIGAIAADRGSTMHRPATS